MCELFAKVSRVPATVTVPKLIIKTAAKTQDILLMARIPLADENRTPLEENGVLPLKDAKITGRS